MSKVLSEIILCTYNSQNFIVRCLDSILPQLSDQIHLQIIDDASTDNTYSLIVSKINSFDRYVKVKHLQINQGLTKNLNWYIANSQADYIFRMDADDIAVPNRFRYQLDYALAHPNLDVIGGQALRIDSSGKVIGKTNKPLDNDRIIKKLYTNPFVHSTVLYKREAILKAGNYNVSHRYGQDYELWFRCAKYGLAMSNLSEVLVSYTVSPTSKYKISIYWNEFVVGLRGSIMVKLNLWCLIPLTSRFFLYSIKIATHHLKNVTLFKL
jgi:glycosyltransferase involved in cell wall biosynthesis